MPLLKPGNIINVDTATDMNPVPTVLAASAASGQSNITLASVAGIAPTMTLGIDTSTLQENKIVSSIAGAIVTLTTTLASSHAAGVAVTGPAAAPQLSSDIVLLDDSGTAMIANSAASAYVPLSWVKYTLDFAVLSGVVGTVSLIGPMLPANFVIMHSIVDTVTIMSPTTGASIAVQLQAANDILSACGTSTATFHTANTPVAGVVVIGTVSGYLKPSLSRVLQAIISGTTITAGKANVLLAGVLSS